MGAERIRGGVEALNFLRQEGKNIFFITNSSIRNRSMLVDRFAHFGFHARPEEVLPAPRRSTPATTSLRSTSRASTRT